MKFKSENTLLIALLATVVLVTVVGIFIPTSANPIESVMFFVRDGFKVSSDETPSVEDTPAFIVPDIPISTVTTVTEEVTEVTTTVTELESEVTTLPEDEIYTSEATTTIEPPVTEATTEPQEEIDNYEDYYSDTLFIGDSRIAGFAIYAKIPTATYFGRPSMNVTNAFSDKPSETEDTSSYTLAQLLTERQFGKIYILLGINEIGYDFSWIVDNYSKTLDYVKLLQPNAKIVIISNLHVTKAKSDANPKTFSNERIDELNSRLKNLADNQTIYYLDCASIFDDASGGLNPEYTGDGIHFYGKCYKLWREWILENGRIVP
ncbi:MAG: hypothetical protein IKU89_05140 [Oscillospiraceae bacterium]|nr:hypothetical protein [Oscillospiraceae bacterium]